MQEQVIAGDYSLKEEVAHSVTHGIGAILSVVGLIILVIHSSMYGDTWHIVSSSIYGLTLITLYTSSTLYHAITVPNVKRFLQKLDHAAIFLLIAGTYTPFTLVNLRGGWGWTLFGIVWSIAIAGMVMELIVKQRYKRVSLGLYLGLGWIVMIAIDPMIAHVETGGLILLLVGGLFYSLGVIFYVWKRLVYHHAIWHLFVLTGSVFHFFAVFYYVIPSAP